MQFNFYRNYQAVQSEELMRIVRHPHEYMPEAVAAATKVLGERGLSETEIAGTPEEAAPTTFLQKKLEEYKAKAEDILEPMLQPQESVLTHKWARLLLVALIVQFLIGIYPKIRYLVLIIGNFVDCSTAPGPGNYSFGTCVTGLLDPYNLFVFFNLFYIPFLIYLLYKRRRWGWIILFADCIISMLSIANSLFMAFYHPGLYNTALPGFLIAALIKSAIIYFLWREDVAGFYNVSKELKIKTIIGAVIFAASFYLLVVAFS